MINKAIELPEGCIPYEELIVCSNTMIQGKVPIRIKDQYPVLIGKGEATPLIWLTGTKDGKEWQPLVVKNVSLNENIAVDFFQDGKSLIIFSGSTIIIHAVRMSDRKAVIDSLDLRPIGFNFHGNKSGLFIGTNLYSGNILQGISAMIDIG